MGLFSSSKKNKHEKLAQDSGHFSRAEDEAIGEKARAKRASNAGGSAARGRKDAPDPVLPEKKRARRRLVGAIALALAAAVGIPMLLDSEPKPLAGDIAIQIPSKDKVAPLPAPAEPAPVAAAETLDKHEEFVDPQAGPAVAPKPETKPVTPEPKLAKNDIKPVDVKPVDIKSVERPAKPDKPKPPKEAKPESHPAAAHLDDNSRALAILEGKVDKPEKAEKVDRAEHGLADADSQKFVLQVAALASQEKVNELQAKLAGAGLRSYTQKGTTSAGAAVIRVRVGPFSKDEAEKIRAKLSAMGLSGSMVPV